MKALDYAVGSVLMIVGALATAIGFVAGNSTSSGWAQLSAGFTTGIGIAIMVVVLIAVTRRAQARRR